jgi:hypothetical protein
MPPRAPIHVPVELRLDGRSRWFRLTDMVSQEGLGLAYIAPEELDGIFGVAFHLPGDPAPIRCRGRVAEEVVGEGEEERAERRAVVFADLDEEARARIANYVNERLGIV